MKEEIEDELQPHLDNMLISLEHTIEILEELVEGDELKKAKEYIREKIAEFI